MYEYGVCGVMGTYKGSVAMTMDDNDEEEQDENTQQLSDINTMNDHNKKNDKTKNNICPWCQKTDHKTWRSVRCDSHQQYLQQKPTKKNKASTTTSTSTHQNEENEKSNENVSDVGVVDVGGDNAPVVASEIAMSDIELLLSISRK